MFLTAISTRSADNVKPGDGGLGQGDITPASFRVEFDEPIRLKNADIELVSCKVVKANEINIEAGQNEISFRIGSELCAEQYTAKIQPGNYPIPKLA